jgi:hypothetical protein
MVTIGSDTQPGTILTVESATSVGANIGAPGVPVILGQADLSNGNASANTASRITRPKQARSEFGAPADSLLTQAIQDALVEGAYPVYAIAPEEKSVTGEDLSGNSGQTATLANSPVIERTDAVTFTVNSTTKTTVFYYEGDPANATPGTDEVYLNPVTGKFKVDESMGSAGDSVDYEYADYTNTFDEVTDASAFGGSYLREVADFMAVVSEEDSVVSSAKDKSASMESNGWFNIALCGAGDPWIDDQATSTDELTGSYSHSYDTSRLQLVHPSRSKEGDTLIGAYAGRRSDAGIDRSPIFDRLKTHTDMLDNLNDAQIEKLIGENVIPIEERSGGARIIDDVTTVSDSNTDESAWRDGFSRLVTDFVAETVDEQSEPFIGEFNRDPVLNALRGQVESELKALLDSAAIEAYSLVVSSVDSQTASVDVGINTSDPLRNIEVTVAAGEVLNAVSTEG